MRSKILLLFTIISVFLTISCNHKPQTSSFKPTYEPGENLPLDENYYVKPNYINVNGKLYEIGDLREKSTFEIEVPKSEKYIITLPLNQYDFAIEETDKIKVSTFIYAFSTPYDGSNREIFYGGTRSHIEFTVEIDPSIKEIVLEDLNKSHGKNDENTCIIISIMD